MIKGKNAHLHAALLNPESELRELDDPASGYLFYGFDNLFLEYTQMVLGDPHSQLVLANFFREELTKLAEALGGGRSWNPEGGSRYPQKQRPEVPATEAILDQIEATVGAPLDFPNPFPNEFGLRTSRGIVSQRSIHAIYQAWRLKQLSSRVGGRVVEIGAGLGRTAYYAIKFGLTDYTIVDLPLTNVAQATFLGSALSPDQVSLHGEADVKRGVRVRPAQWLDENRETFDIFFNADSFTEMSLSAASGYVDRFRSGGKALLSINHEANLDRVADIEGLAALRQSRHPYWMRAGYVEELFETGASVNASRADGGVLARLAACFGRAQRLERL